MMSSDIWIFYAAGNEKKKNGPVTGHKPGTFAQLVRMLRPTEYNLNYANNSQTYQSFLT